MLGGMKHLSPWLFAALVGCGANVTSTNVTPQDSGTPAADVVVTDLGPPPADVKPVDVPPPPPPPDVPPPEEDAGPSRTLEYAFTQLVIDPTTDATVAHTGFNVDGRFSVPPLQDPDCAHRDFYSALDPDQNRDGCMGGTTGCAGGVDNQLPELASAAQMLIDLRAQITASVASGAITLLVRLEGVNSLVEDRAVTVSIYRGHPMFASCANIGTPGQPYAIDESALSAGMARYRFDGFIHNGRFGLTQATGMMGNTFPLPGVLEGPASLTLNQFNLRATLTEDRGTDGNLGGYVLRSDVIAALLGIPGAAMYRPIVEGLINGLVDVSTMGSCDNPNGGLGMGMGVTLTRAVIQAAPIAAPAPGMCGSSM